MARVFFPQFKKGREGIRISRGTILEAARELGVEVISECGGRGKCGKCVVRIEKGEENLNSPTDIERDLNLGKNERLACQAKIIGSGDVYVFVKSVGKFSILSDTLEDKIEINPFVSRKNGVVMWNDEVLDKDRGNIYGLAIDVGTTTLVLQVVDLETGEKIATLADKNPQASYGDDVISRIDWTMRKKNGLKELHQVIINGVNEVLAKIDKEKGQISEKIYEVVVVGNSTMRNIFFGLDVSSLGVIPFEPQNKDPINQKASCLNLAVNPKANVYGPPLIGGHAGADVLADIVVTEIYACKKVSMIIDIGTNGEVVIGNKDRILTASCAAGGAYEGATVGSGIGAVEGAIKNVSIVDDKVEYETIGNKPAVGICGSGLIDLLGELLKNGIMTEKAKLLKNPFYITKDIGISQQDIYQLITAKAGLRLDQDLLIKYYGTTLDEIDKIYLSGAFGNFINLSNAIAIGLLPDAEEKIVKIGNGALAGARQILISREKRKIAENIAKRVEHVKPNEREKDFIYLVAEKMYF